MSSLTRLTFTRIFTSLVGICLLSTHLYGQADLAGRYVGSMNTSVTAGPLSLESGFGVYIADVTAAGAIDLNGGALTGTVSAGGAVSFTGGTQLTNLAITTATIENGTLSSAYGGLVGNGTTRYKINGSTGFTASGGSSGGGGSGGGDGGGSTSSGDLLAYYSFDNPNDLLNDDSGRGVTLTSANGIPAFTTGAVGDGAFRSNGIRLRALVNSTFSSDTVSVSYFVRVRGAGSWNPRMVAVQRPGSSSHYYGTFLDGTDTSSARRFASYHAGGGIYYSPDSAALATASEGAWQHVAMTHDGSNIRLYHNGVEVLNQVDAGALSAFSSGMLSIGGSDNNLDLFEGDFDEIRIYNRALTAAEVSTLSEGTNVGAAGDDSGSTGSITADVIAAPNNLVGYRNRVGQSLQFTVTGSTSGGVWGAGVYTDDSAVAAAAVHAGVVAPGQTAEVTITIKEGQSSYTATTANGVTSRSWGRWGGSYAFANASNVAIGQSATAAPAVDANFTIGNISSSLGQRLVLPIDIDGIGPFAFQWYLNGVAIAGATSNPYVVPQVSGINAGTYTVDVTNIIGTTNFTAGTVAVNGPGAPIFALQPFDKVVPPGGTFALATSAVGSDLVYQWYLNGAALAGETGSILLRNTANAGDAGPYTVQVSNSDGSIMSQAATVSLDPMASTLRNISVRTNAAPGQIITPGFAISGAGTKRILMRAVGPGLSQFDVAGVMPNPQITVYDENQNIVASNDDWDGAITPAFVGVGAFAIENGSRDAGLLVDLPANKRYTAQVTDADGQGGIVLLEVYDTDENPTSKLVNVSVRSNADSGSDALIMGMSLQGTGKRTLLVRGIGPTLGGFGVPNTIPNPELTIFDVNQRSVLSNTDWSDADFVYELLAATDFVGAFALGAGTGDAATLSLLDPGNYTIQITPTDDHNGEALVEIYEVP